MYEKTEYHGMKKHATLPMITGQVKHSEIICRDAENWVQYESNCYQRNMGDN